MVFKICLRFFLFQVSLEIELIDVITELVVEIVYTICMFFFFFFLIFFVSRFLRYPHYLSWLMPLNHWVGLRNYKVHIGKNEWMRHCNILVMCTFADPDPGWQGLWQNHHRVWSAKLAFKNEIMVASRIKCYGLGKNAHIREKIWVVGFLVSFFLSKCTLLI